ncbi:MAG: caspase family protein, partial [Pseudomonadota bacterium]
MNDRPRRRLRLCFAWLALLPLWLAAGGAGATQRALLVGVSELVNQPAALWLQAPRNDVLLMRDALQRQGFAPADIALLADGVPGAALPDAAGIHDALARLLAQSAPGDFVLLYFSGHGTRLRDTAKRYQEPDGLAENFLARDVRGTLGGTAPLVGGLRDAEVDAWIGAFLARDVFVWAMFDTCSAASMTRGGAVPAARKDLADVDDEVRFRGVRVDQLVNPSASAIGGAGAGGSAGLGSNAEVSTTVSASASASPSPAGANVPRARYVAFFASESHQVTPELKLPRKDRTARPQGLLTWAVSEALQRKPATWRELFNGVLALYPPVIDELELRFPGRELPSPVAEGNLDLPLFANTAAPLSTRPEWRAQRRGGRLAVEAGALDGLEAAQPVRVLATLADGTVRSADAVVAQLAPGQADVALPAALDALPEVVQWALSPIGPPSGVALRVASAGALPEGLSLGYPSGIVRVPSGSASNASSAPADVRWHDMGAAGQRIDVLSPALVALLAPSSAASFVVPDRAALRERLQDLARLKWLARLPVLAGSQQLDGFEASV